MTSAYVEYGARVAAPPPFTCREGHFQALIVDGVEASLNALCEKMLNGPADGAAHYTPIGEQLLILTGCFARVTSQAPGFSERGSARETQLSLWVPTCATYPQTSPKEGVNLCMVVPFIFVDNPMSLLGGREDFGYPKAMGQFAPTDALGTVVTLAAFGGDFAPTNQAAWCPLLELEGPQSAAARDAQEGWKSGPELVQLFSDRAGDAGPTAAATDLTLIGSLIEALLDGRAQQVFLKQFRDADSADTACYQAVVEAPVRVSNVRWRPSLHEWTLTIDHLDSHPIDTELGVKSQTTRLTYELDFDMSVGIGTIVAPPPATG